MSYPTRLGMVLYGGVVPCRLGLAQWPGRIENLRLCVTLHNRRWRCSRQRPPSQASLPTLELSDARSHVLTECLCHLSLVLLYVICMRCTTFYSFLPSLAALRAKGGCLHVIRTDWPKPRPRYSSIGNFSVSSSYLAPRYLPTLAVIGQ
jgi:hypothetical protein